MLAWRAKSMTLLEFEVLLFLIGARLRLHAAARRHRAAEQRVDPHVRIGGRHHAVLAQPVRHHAGRGVRRDHPVRREPGRRAGRSQYSVEGFVHVFLAVAASFAVALTAMFLLDEKPLETKHS